MRTYLYIMIGILLFGCVGTDRPTKPDNLISKNKMADIIYDVFLLNAAKGINKRILENNGVQPQEYIYKKYNIDSLQFVLSNNYYSYDTKTYESIMEKVKQKIDLEKTKNDSIDLKEVKIKDSLNSMKLKSKDSLNKIKLQVLEIDTLGIPKPKLIPKVFGSNND